jgi:outer membrane protein assembly factor BamB
LTGVTQSTVPASLKVAWTYEAGEPIESSAAIADGVVYVGTQSAELLALDLKTGKLLWKYKTSEGIGESSPCVADGVVYVGDLAGMVHAVGKDGKGLWTFKTGSEIKASPVVVDDRVLIGSYDETPTVWRRRPASALAIQISIRMHGECCQRHCLCFRL